MVRCLLMRMYVGQEQYVILLSTSPWRIPRTFKVRESPPLYPQIPAVRRGAWDPYTTSVAGMPFSNTFISSLTEWQIFMVNLVQKSAPALLSGNFGWVLFLLYAKRGPAIWRTLSRLRVSIPSRGQFVRQRILPGVVIHHSRRLRGGAHPAIGDVTGASGRTAVGGGSAGSTTTGREHGVGRLTLAARLGAVNQLEAVDHDGDRKSVV